MRERNLLLDYLKGLAIFLVIWGHCLQFATTSTFDFFSNQAFVIIYSFHMPLFMVISGYLFFLTQKNKSFTGIAWSKTQQILIPLLIWGGVMLLIPHVRAILQGRLSGIITAPQYIESITGGFWFLWCSYVCALLNAFVNKFVKDQLWAYVLITTVILLLPNDYNFYFVKFTLPYFFAGYLYHKYIGKLQGLRTAATYASFLLFPVLLLLWDTTSYIYVSGRSFNLLSFDEGLGIIIYRYAIGAIGILFFTTVATALRLVLSEGVVSKVGKQSFGIYIIGGVVNMLLVTRLHIPSDSTLVYTFIWTPMLAVFVTGVSYLVTMLLSKIRLANRLLLGGR